MHWLYVVLGSLLVDTKRHRCLLLPIQIVLLQEKSLYFRNCGTVFHLTYFEDAVNIIHVGSRVPRSVLPAIHFGFTIMKLYPILI